MEMKGALTMAQSAERMAHSGEDPRYYTGCPIRNHKTVPVTKCFGCEFATGYTFEHWPASGKVHVEIACNFPNRARRKL